MQIPAPFDYVRAPSVPDAVALLVRHGPEARVVAGGHSLLPMMKLRLARPEWLVDINELYELDFILARPDQLRVGAMTRHAALLGSAVVGDLFQGVISSVTDQMMAQFATNLQAMLAVPGAAPVDTPAPTPAAPVTAAAPPAAPPAAPDSLDGLALARAVVVGQARDPRVLGALGALLAVAAYAAGRRSARRQGMGFCVGTIDRLLASPLVQIAARDL